MLGACPELLTHSGSHQGRLEAEWGLQGSGPGAITNRELL